ncbi:Lipoprotein [Bacillus cereus]|nr:Lipoprotein [Bacillus cereus]
MRKWMLIGAMSCVLLTACSTQADNNTEVQQLKVENDTLQKESSQLQQEPIKTQAAANDRKQIQDFKTKSHLSLKRQITRNQLDQKKKT